MFFSNWFLPSSSQGIKPRSLCLHDEHLTDQVTSLVFYLYTFQKGYLWYRITRWTTRGRRKPTWQRLKVLSVLMSLGDHAERLDEEAATFYRVSRCWLRMSSAPSWRQWAEEQSLFVYWQLSNIITSMTEHLVKEEEAMHDLGSDSAGRKGILLFYQHSVNS